MFDLWTIEKINRRFRNFIWKNIFINRIKFGNQKNDSASSTFVYEFF